MKYFENVRSTTKPLKKVIDEYSVYVNTDVKEVLVTRGQGEWKRTITEYEYNQTQYTKDEYIKLIDDKNEALEAEMTDTQLALCEVYEMML